MHYLFGNAAVAEHSLQRNIDGELKLSQRMRLEQTQLDGVSRKMQVKIKYNISKRMIHIYIHINLIYTFLIVFVFTI